MKTRKIAVRVEACPHVYAFYIVQRKLYVKNLAATPNANLIRLDYDP